jgi:quinol monooxygenase YgiN
MIIVAGRIHVATVERDAYLIGCEHVVREARTAVGCLDFALSADVVDPSRINIFERWESPETLMAFRGSGEQPDGLPEIVSADVLEFDVDGEPSRP